MLETEDLYLSAYALTCGGELARVDVRPCGGRLMAVFVIAGDLGAAEAAYWRGEAMVNLHLLRAQLRRLKDRAFDAVRAEERRHAVAEAGRIPAAVAGGLHRRHRR